MGLLFIQHFKEIVEKVGGKPNSAIPSLISGVNFGSKNDQIYSSTIENDEWEKFINSIVV